MKTLQELIEIAKHAEGIKKDVLNDLIDAGDDWEAHLHDILTSGCKSGTVSRLIYYTDTEKFFNTHYHEIEEIREEYTFQTGEPLTIEGDLRNGLAWFSYEQTAYILYEELTGDCF
jgi:hypothetical protein